MREKREAMAETISLSDGYGILAPVYNKLNRTADYPAWADYIERCIEKFGQTECGESVSILDLGCGTGTMTLELAGRGYDMIGLDLSSEMLAEADASARAAGHNILFVCENMCSFELYGTVDHVICCLDGINHLTNREDLLACFSLVCNYLNPGGLFIFDLNTPHKFRTAYGNRDYVLEDDGVMCCQRIRLSKKGDVVDFYLTVFEETEDGEWRRSDGVETERAYGLRSIENSLKACGMELVNVSAGYDFESPDDKTERWYIAARKPNTAPCWQSDEL